MFSRRKHIAWVPVIMLLVFASAFTTNALCDLEVIDYASNLTHQHNNGHGHQEDHHHGEATGHNGHHGDNHQHGQAAEETCCEEISGNLEAGLFFSHFAVSLPAVKYFLLKTINFGAKLLISYKQLNIIYYQYEDPPPLEGFGLRVVIQSFLN